MPQVLFHVATSMYNNNDNNNNYVDYVDFLFQYYCLCCAYQI